MTVEEQSFRALTQLRGESYATRRPGSSALQDHHRSACRRANEPTKPPLEVCRRLLPWPWVWTHRGAIDRLCAHLATVLIRVDVLPTGASRHGSAGRRSAATAGVAAAPLVWHWICLGRRAQCTSRKPGDTTWQSRSRRRFLCSIWGL